MLTPDQAIDRLSAIIERARRAGADAADAHYSARSSTGVSVRLGALEDVGRSEGSELSLRVFVGQQSASVSSSDLSRDALAALVERSVAMAREAPEDPYAGLAPEDMLLKGAIPDVDGDDALDPAPDVLKALAQEAEDAARAVPGVTNSEGGGANAGRTIGAIATSHGFAGGYSTSGYSLYASVIAGGNESGGAGMQRDYAQHSARHLGDLESPLTIGRRAGERAVARLNPAKLSSGAMPVLFDPRVGHSLIGHLLGAIAGGAIARRTSFLLDARGTAVFAPGVDILDDPLRPRGLRSRPFDSEGLRTAPSRLIDDGVLTNWTMDSAAARQLGEKPTGHSGGMSNLRMAPGPLSPAELMADVKTGIYVTELIGQGINGVTGDYSRGAAGFLIENGQLGPAVAEITIAGNLKDMFRALTPANDLEIRRGVDTPTIRVDGMIIAGA